MTAAAALALAIWVYLLAAHGRFWQAKPVLQGATHPSPIAAQEERIEELPPVSVIIPARDEAEHIEAALRSLLAQDYAGKLHVIVVDDESNDDTAARARAFDSPRLTVIRGARRPPGWSGKLWAVAQGVDEAERQGVDLILLTDADIVHDPAHLSALVEQAGRYRLDQVSEMVMLACDSIAERALVPAFVYFFQLLYPFARVNDPLAATAAAAGGTILVRRRALDRIGGIATIRTALIDDVALARAVKRGGRIWLGHSTLARSMRRYPGFADIWRMIARTAYVQLRHSPLLLVLCIAGLALTFLAPPVTAIWARGAARILGALGWAAMAASYVPILRRFGRSTLWAPFLPLVAIFYMGATLGSALHDHFGRGVVWKDRAYGRATSG